MQTKTTRPRKPHPFGLLHRYGGIFSAVLVIFICTTGLVLNHTDDLGLGRKHINSDWLLDLYGIETAPVTSFVHADLSASQAGSAIYLGSEPVPGNSGDLRGIIKASGSIIIATTDSLILLNNSGELIETLTSHTGAPAGIKRIGVLSGNPVLDTGNAYLRGDPQLLEWASLDKHAIEPDVSWSLPASLPVETEQQIAASYRGHGLTLERIMLDLHSGRILGSFGPLLADLAAIIFILLAMTGIWMWFKTRR